MSMGKVKSMHEARKLHGERKMMKEKEIRYCHNSGRSRSTSDNSTHAPNQQ